MFAYVIRCENKFNNAEIPFSSENFEVAYTNEKDAEKKLLDDVKEMEQSILDEGGDEDSFFTTYAKSDEGVVEYANIKMKKADSADGFESHRIWIDKIEIV